MTLDTTGIREYDHEVEEERFYRRRQRCQCDPELPGVCPGPENCPMVEWEEGEEDE